MRKEKREKHRDFVFLLKKESEKLNLVYDSYQQRKASYFNLNFSGVIFALSRLGEDFFNSVYAGILEERRFHFDLFYFHGKYRLDTSSSSYNVFFRKIKSLTEVNAEKIFTTLTDYLPPFDKAKRVGDDLSIKLSQYLLSDDGDSDEQVVNALNLYREEVQLVKAIADRDFSAFFDVLKKRMIRSISVTDLARALNQVIEQKEKGQYQDLLLTAEKKHVEFDSFLQKYNVDTITRERALKDYVDEASALAASCVTLIEKNSPEDHPALMTSIEDFVAFLAVGDHDLALRYIDDFGYAGLREKPAQNVTEFPSSDNDRDADRGDTPAPAVQCSSFCRLRSSLSLDEMIPSDDEDSFPSRAPRGETSSLKPSWMKSALSNQVVDPESLPPDFDIEHYSADSDSDSEDRPMPKTPRNAPRRHGMFKPTSRNADGEPSQLKL